MSRPALTTRAAVLGLVAVALVVMAAVPAREYLAQRATLRRLTLAQQAQQQRIADLQNQVRQWHDPAFVAAQARQRLHFVRPGETDYLLLVPPSQRRPPKAAGTAAAPAAQQPWYAQQWAGLRAADAAAGR